MNLRRTHSRDMTSSPRGEVGEIDTRAPFQSVKAAVSLFGEVAVSTKERPAALPAKKKSADNVLDKETQLMLAQRELNKIRLKLDSAETTKSKAHTELEKAKLTLNDLSTKLAAVREAKQAAIEVAEAVKNQAKQLEDAKSQKAVGFEGWKRELELARKEYLTTVTELDASKQELNKVRQDFDAALEAKSAAFQAAAEAQRSANMNTEKACELSKQIAAMKASIEELKLASGQAQKAQAKAMAEKEAQLGNFKNAQEEAEKKLISLKKEYDPEQTRDIEAKLAETSAEIEILQEEMKKAHASEMETVRGVTSELNEATKALQDVAEEESKLRNLVSSLRMELDQVKKEQDNLREKEQAAETLVAHLSGQLESSKIAESEQSSMNLVSELTMKIHQLSSETRNARRGAEEKSKRTQELKQEVKTARDKAEEAEKKLEIVLREAEEAKAAQKRALEEMKILSEMQGGTDVAKSVHSGKIKLSVEEFEALNRKSEECENLVEKVEAAAIAQVKEIDAKKNEADKKVEANLKAIEEIETATDIALKNAEMAESAKLVVEGELRRWRQQEHKVASEASS